MSNMAPSTVLSLRGPMLFTCMLALAGFAMVAPEKLKPTTAALVLLPPPPPKPDS